jgi:hypothetical protein
MKLSKLTKQKQFRKGGNMNVDINSPTTSTSSTSSTNAPIRSSATSEVSTNCSIGEEHDVIDHDEVDLPIYMKARPEEMFCEAITKRKNFANVVSQLDTILNPKAREIINITNDANTISWIGGSRSWNKVYEKDIKSSNCRIDDKNALTNASVNVIGNYDIFVMHNGDVNSFKSLLTDINDKIIELRNQLNNFDPDNFNFTFKVEYPRGAFNSVNVAKLNMCTISPCKAVMLTMTTTKSRTRSGSPQSAQSPTFEDKLLVYIEIGFVKDLRVEFMRDNLIMSLNSLNYLNGYGLIMFSMLIDQSRVKEKGLDVDLYRDNLIKCYLKSHKTHSVFIDKIIQLYRGSFPLNIPFYQENLSKLYIDNILRHHQELADSKTNLKEQITIFVIEALRPMINTCILLIQQVLNAKINESYGAYIVMVGGDAMRRYEPNITITNDIDTKIFYNGNNTKKFLELILSCTILCTKLLEYTTVYDVKKSYSYKPSANIRYNLNSKTNAASLNKSYTVSWESIKTSNGVDLDENALNSKGNNIFRPRFIEESDSFPVNLFSIDMCVPIEVNIENQRYKSKLTIPVLDIVVQKRTKTQNKQDDITFMELNPPSQSSSTKFPNASLGFLIKDLEKTYSNEDTACARFLNLKNEKDKGRLETLRQIQQTSIQRYDFKLNYIFRTFNRVHAFTKECNEGCDLPAVINVYRKQMKYKMTANKRKRIYKHKLPFSINYITAIPSSKCSEFDWSTTIYNNIQYDLITRPIGGIGGKRKIIRNKNKK